MPVGAVLAVGAVSVGAGAYEASQSQGIAKQGLALAQGTTSGQSYYAGLLQDLIANPSSVTNQPGYQFTFNQGASAVAAKEAAGGFGGSGNEATALTQYGQGEADSFYNEYEQQLAQLSGLTAPSSPAQDIGAASGAQSGASNTLSGILNSLGYSAALATSVYGGSAGTPSTFGGGSLATGSSLGIPGSSGYSYNIPGQ